MAVELFHKVYPHPTSERTLVILHGLFGMLDNWHNMARRLSEHLNVVTVDQRNHGHSPHTSSMSFEAMAEDLEALLDQLGISKAVVLGHSMGGKTAMVFADHYPDRVESLIVVDIAPKEYQPGHTLYFNAFKEIDFSQFSRRKEADEAFAQVEPNAAVRLFLLKNLERSESGGFQLKPNIAGIEEFYPAMIGEVKFQWVIGVPTLFIYGMRSGYITEEDQHRIEEQFTEVEFAGIADAGHWVHAEQPDKFFEVTLSFLQKD